MSSKNDGLKDEIKKIINAASCRQYFEFELGSLPPMNTSGECKTRCPLPGHEDNDPSFSINFFKAQYHCHGCKVGGDIFEFYMSRHNKTFPETLEYFADFLGIDSSVTYKPTPKKKYGKVVKTYHYTDLNDKIIHETCRTENPKNFFQQRPDPKKPDGKRIPNLNGVTTILYNLKEVVASDIIYIVEGEKDCDNLAKIGLVGTCNAQGAGKWPSHLSEWLKDKDIVILPDQDDPGRNHAKLVSNKLYDVAKSIKVLNLPGLKEGGDVSDWLAAGNTKETLVELVANTKSYEDHIDWLNSRHASIMLGGKYAILNEFIDPLTGNLSINFSTIHDFEYRYANRKIPNPRAGEKGQKNKIAITYDWKNSSRQRQYDGYIFAPGKNVNGYYNAWRGFLYAPHPGNVGPYIDHVETIICNGDGPLAVWILDWVSDIFQNIHNGIPGSAVVTRGKKGTGKGLFTYPLELILGTHFVPVTGESEFLGQFNSHIAHAVIIYANEAFWGGRKGMEGQLKARITEKTILMNEKYLPSIKINNHARIIMASNENWVVPATEDERRFCVSNVSDERKGDKEYFAKMFEWCDNKENISALLHYFQTRKITSNLRNPPITEGLIEQIELSMNSIKKFWINCVEENFIGGGDGIAPNPNGFGGWVRSGRKNDSVHSYYLDFCKDIGERYPKPSHVLSRKLGEICEKIIREKHTFIDGQYRGLKMPTIDECRDDYNKKVGIKHFILESLLKNEI